MKTPLFFLLMLLVVMPAMAQTILFEDDFEMANFKPQWTPIPGVPNGIVDIANGWGFDDSRGARLGKSSSAGGYVSNALDLHLNLAGQTQVAMTFKIGDVADETDYDDAIYFSNNGGLNFERVFVFEPSDWCDQYGQFPPLDIDQLAAQNGLTLTSQFVIRFQQSGEDYLPYYDGFYLDDVRVYVPDLTYAPLPFTDTFETGAFGSMWTWSFADQTNSLADIPTRPSNLVDIATAIGFNSSRGVRMGKTCSDGPATNALDLHLNLAGQTQVAMTFKIRDVADETDYDDAIYFSNNGGLNFERVFVFEPSDWCDQYGQFPPLDIDQLAAPNGLTLTSQFVIRFQQSGEDYLPYYDGFYLDDVHVYVPDLTYAPLPFTDTFETGAFGSMWTWSFADQTNSLADIPTRPSNLVDIATNWGFDNSRGVRMGKTCSDGPATNALDLHLNLAGQTQVAMTFKIGDVADETDYDDAIFFSNNGGLNFERVFVFEPSDWCDQYGQFPPLDIDQLAAQNGLTLTSQFVIRFQQHGEDYLPYYDGFYLDDVAVYVPDLTYAPLPFTDTFETGAFGSMWTWSFADQTNSLADIPTRPSNLVDIATAIGFNSSRGVRMGKTCSDGPATNALDLHLNLAGQTQVAMTFKIRDVADETDYDDAIYFSNNGGITFEKVYSFVWGATADVYTDYNLNISNLAATNGLALTNQFVIRFQQYGEDYLPYYDGIYLDNVQVTGTSTGIESTAANPAQDLLLVYPNPAGSWLHLNTAIPHLQEGGIIQIFSATGQLALQHTPGVAGGGNPVAIDHLAPGLYFVQLTTPQGNYCQRMVKQ